jgi:hypothetical protein
LIAVTFYDFIQSQSTETKRIFVTVIAVTDLYDFIQSQSTETKRIFVTLIGVTEFYDFIQSQTTELRYVIFFGLYGIKYISVNSSFTGASRYIDVWSQLKNLTN